MRHVKVLLIIYLSVWTIVLGFAPLSGYAMLLPSTDGSMQRQSDLNRIQTQLESKLVSERLNALGLTQQEVQARMQDLSDDQIHNLAQNVEGLQFGGDGGLLILILAVIGALVLISFLFSATTGTAHDTGHAIADDHHHYYN
jgi:Flp pilus assembly protein TadB